MKKIFLTFIIFLFGCSSEQKKECEVNIGDYFEYKPNGTWYRPNVNPFDTDTFFIVDKKKDWIKITPLEMIPIIKKLPKRIKNNSDYYIQLEIYEFCNSTDYNVREINYKYNK